jgi:hypothetical protein
MNFQHFNSTIILLMNRFKLAKTYKSLLPYFLSLIISLPALSQVTAPAPSGACFTGSQGNSRNPMTQEAIPQEYTRERSLQIPILRLEISSRVTLNRLISKILTRRKMLQKAQNGDANTDQSKVNKTTSSSLTPEDQEKEAFRQKIYGYSLFADKSLNPIPDIQIATPTNYIVGPGDELKVYLYNYAESTYETIVNKDGFISIPRVGNVFVSGRTIEEVRKILIDKFAKFTPGLIGTGGETARTKLMVTLGEIRSVKVL